MHSGSWTHQFAAQDLTTCFVRLVCECCPCCVRLSAGLCPGVPLHSVRKWRRLRLRQLKRLMNGVDLHKFWNNTSLYHFTKQLRLSSQQDWFWFWHHCNGLIMMPLCSVRRGRNCLVRLLPQAFSVKLWSMHRSLCAPLETSENYIDQPKQVKVVWEKTRLPRVSWRGSSPEPKLMQNLEEGCGGRSSGLRLNKGMANGEPSTTENRVPRTLPPVRPRFRELLGVPLKDLSALLLPQMTCKAPSGRFRWHHQACGTQRYVP